MVQDVKDEDADDSDLDLVVDAVYTWETWAYMLSLSPLKTERRSGESNSGFYLEGNYALTDKLSAYLGMTAAEDLVGKDKDRIVAGAKYKIAPATALQGEVVNCDDENNITLRLRVDF